VKRKFTTIFLCLGAISVGLSGCYWGAGTTATPMPTATYQITALPSAGPIASINAMESPITTTVQPSILASPIATTVSTTKATNLTLSNAIVNISKIKSAVVVRNGENALVGVMFDRDKYNGDLTDALEQEIANAMVAKDSSLTNIIITDNITYYYDIEDISKETGLSAEQLQQKMDSVLE